MTRTLRARYESDLHLRGHIADAGQGNALAALERLTRRLVNNRPAGLLDRLRGARQGATRGLYLYGGVGRGKTYLMDLFFESLPIEAKRRTHFHRFMRDTHEQLGALGEKRNPLELLARRTAGETRVLCFDEFFVSDIGDAMILGNLLRALFRHGVTLVATSNVAPHDLYRDGLQRQRFLPAIDLIENNVEVVDIGEGTDYRLRMLEAAEIYHYPLDCEAETNLAGYFEEIACEDADAAGMLQIANRLIAARRAADGVAWFDFAELCTAPRAAADYLEIARLYHTVLLSGVPVLDDERNDDARRFISLVDVFYDHHVKLIVSAAAPPGETYRGQRLSFEFQRTSSRLHEMQQTAYLALPHLP